MSELKISILLATYNGEKYLSQQIDSILTQSNQNLQLLIRDDGSTDQTVKIIEDYAAKHTDKIELIKDDSGHLGLTENFARLLEHAKSSYIMFCDQDDVWLPNKIEITLNLMKSAEAIYPDKPILVHTDLKIVDSNLKPIAESMWFHQRINPIISNSLYKIMAKNIVTGCTMMINKKARDICLPVPSVARVHDWWIAINVEKYGKIVSLSLPTVLYRQHRTNIIGTKSTEKLLIENIWGKIFHLKERLSNHFKMVKKIYPKVSLTWLLINMIRIKIARLLP
ncbi:MAG: glycosyltransferase family 2 protein [Sedimentisphaerales bacterium]|nr:glycosyltransferase family 2 protein [Sedimentisphaerales bacterium]